MITSSDLGIAVTTGYGKLHLKTAPTTPVITTAEAKTHLRIDSSFTADDTYIDALVSAATQSAENYLNMKIMEQTWQLFLDCFPSYIDLMTSNPRALVVNSIKYLDTKNISQTLDSSNYVVDDKIKPSRVYKSVDGSFPDTYESPNAVTVEFTLGYSSANDVPNAIKQAILLLVGSMYENRMSVSDRSYKEVPQTVEFLLELYRVQR